MSEWIKCSTRLPEISEDVLMRVSCASYFNIEQGSYLGEGRWLNCWLSSRNENLYPVTHWQPLPSSPKEQP